MTQPRIFSGLALMALAACAPKPAEPAAEAPVDQAAVRTELDALRAQYRDVQLAGNAAGTAALFAETAAVDFHGAPPMRGRAAIEAGMAASYGLGTWEAVEISAEQTMARTNANATEVGTYHNAQRINGKLTHNWGRWAGGSAKDSTGAWRLNYLIAFPDSTKVDK